MAKLIVAKTGGTIGDAEKNLAFTSSRDCLIELLSGTQSVASTGYYQHGLGYNPAYTVFAKKIVSSVSGVPNNCWTPVIGIIGNALDFDGSVSIDTDKLYFETYTDDEGYPVTTDFYYSIFANTISNATGSGNSNASGKIKIAKSGYSVPNISDARQFQFFAGNVFKQDRGLSGSLNITLPDYDVTMQSVYHGLGYVPIVYAFEDNNGSRIPYGAPDGTLFTYYISATHLYIVGGNFINPGGDIYTIRYIILRDKIA